MVKPPPKGAPKRKAAPPVLKPSKRAKTIKNARAAASAPKPKPGQAPKESNVGLNGKPKRRPDQVKKVKLRDQGVIPVPRGEFDVGRRRRPVVAGSRDNEEDGSEDEEEEDDGDEDGDDLMDLGEEEGLEAGFLLGMDRQALSRTTKETKRLHQLSKTQEQMPVKKRQKSRLPSPGSASTMSDFDINSDDELPSDSELNDSELDDSVVDTEGEVDEEDGDENESDDDVDADVMDAFDNLSEDMDKGDHKKRKGKRREEEADYEMSGRSRWAGKPEEEDGEQVEVGRLPIKLPSGEVQQVEGTTKIELPASKKRKAKPEPVEEEEEEEGEDEEDQEGAAARMATTKGRFGRMGVAEIVGHEGWKNARKLEAAKEQIAALGAEILAGGELVDTIPTLTRLSTFSLPTVTSPNSSTPLTVPNSVRGLSLLSQLAVYKDLVPGYRIRQLTEAEEAEKVRDEVKRMREGEKGLVRTYKAYLKTLETEIRKKSPLSTLSIKCYCDLLSAIPHFNFSENIMGVLVGKIGRRSWDEDSDLILATFIAVFKADLTSTYSQTLVRLIARMTKERKFQIHPDVLSCLLHLRLHTELDQMVANRKDQKAKNNSKKFAGRDGKDKDGKEKKEFKSEIKKKWQTKNQKKKEKEMKEVEKDMKEAEAEIDLEERAQVQTETLKNLFVLYFLILKNQQRTPLLPTALEGITHFGHFINIEFFRDLLTVLRRIVVEEPQPILTDAKEAEEEEEIYQDPVGDSERIRTRLLAIATAFEILSGQGEALNIDLSDFINALFGLLRPLSLDTGIDDPTSYTPLPSNFFGRPSRFRLLVPGRLPPKTTPLSSLPTSQILLRCLHSVFFARHATNPPWRTAAFVKRLTECSLFFPPAFAKTVLELVATLLSRDAKLEGLLDTEERTFDGTYKPELDDPQLVNTFATSLYEVLLIEGKYWEKSVKEEGRKLGLGNPNSVQQKM